MSPPPDQSSQPYPLSSLSQSHISPPKQPSSPISAHSSSFQPHFHSTHELHPIPSHLSRNSRRSHLSHLSQTSQLSRISQALSHIQSHEDPELPRPPRQPSPPQPGDNVPPPSDEVTHSRLTAHYCGLVLSSMLGCLIRLGLEALGNYDGKIVFQLLWAQGVGCGIMGFALGRKNEIIAIYPPLYTFFTTGVAGSVTTFSSWMLEGYLAFSNFNGYDRKGLHDTVDGVAYSLTTFTVSLSCLIFGEHLASILPPLPSHLLPGVIPMEEITFQNSPRSSQRPLSHSSQRPRSISSQRNSTLGTHQFESSSHTQVQTFPQSNSPNHQTNFDTLPTSETENKLTFPRSIDTNPVADSYPMVTSVSKNNIDLLDEQSHQSPENPHEEELDELGPFQQPESSRYLSSTPLLDSLTILSSLISYLIILLLYFFAPHSWRHKVLFPLLLSPPGAILRFFLSRLNTFPPFIDRFPIGTFLSNIPATLLVAGMFAVQRRPINPVGCRAAYGVQQGLCGCWSTVSTFVVESRAIRRKRWRWFYVLFSVVVGHLCVLFVVGGTGWSEGYLDQCVG
ncbi:hypothetical protein M231_01760 [Tremella mesenterica]|uniref:Chromosome condensation protein n=1 Tax=Tremella mesenterica TaxID=5217 RepID=A0A4Q1BSP1_TREME|nr:hypothetical protein M231_01760 [Tremella mesenterica]